MEKRLFEKAYTLPFRVDRDISWVWDINHNFAFQFMIELPEEKILEFENIINGKSKPKFENEYVYEHGVIRLNGSELILIRGWGYLTGGGGLNLPYNEAVAIQEDLAAYIIEKLTIKL